MLPEYYWVYGPAFDVDASEAAADGRVLTRRRQHGVMPISKASETLIGQRPDNPLVELETSQLSLQVNRVPKENLVKKFAPYASNQPLYGSLRYSVSRIGEPRLPLVANERNRSRGSLLRLALDNIEAPV